MWLTHTTKVLALPTFFNCLDSISYERKTSGYIRLEEKCDFCSFLQSGIGRRARAEEMWIDRALPTQCLKIIEKVAFNIASKASYVHILSGQKFAKNAKNGQIWRVFENLKLEV